MNSAAEKLLSPRGSLWATGIFFLVLLVVYQETVLSMVAIWSRSDTFAHGFLILPISLWLIWTRRDYLVAVKPVPAPWVALLLIPGSFAWLLAWLVDVLVIQQLALVGMIAVGAWSILGHRLGALLAFPLFFLFFAVPMGEGLIAPMMDFTAMSTVWLIQLSGIPVFREGLFFTLPSGRWSVVEACSGVRYIIASVTVGALFAYLTYVTWWRRALFLLISAIVPVFANTLRAYIIVMLGHWSDMKIATGADHLLYGWVFFGIVIFILFWLGSLFREEPDSAEEVAAARNYSGEKAVPRARVVVALCLAIVAASAIPVAVRVMDTGAANAVPVEIALPQAAGEWRRDSAAPWSWKPVSMVSGQRRASYVRDGAVVALELQYTSEDFEPGEVIGSSRLFSAYDSPWKVVGRDLVTVSSGGSEWVVDQARVRGGNTELLAWSWYVQGDLQTSNDYIGKVRQAAAKLGLAEPGATRVLLITPLQLDEERTRPSLHSFIEGHGAALVENLRRAYSEAP